MQLFYDPNLQTGQCELVESEARHAVQVLRKKVGDTLDLVNGNGGWFRGEIVSTGKKSCVLEVELIRQEDRRADFRLNLIVAPTKSNDRYEWLLEKATEIGVDSIQPFVSSNSERRKIRLDRMERVLESAMKQSLQAWLPKLHPLVRLQEVLEMKNSDTKLIAWINDEVKSFIPNNYRAGQDVSILIGPEGGFTGEEAQLAINAGYRAVSLGGNRLRTETAAITAAQCVAQLNWSY